MAIVLVVLFGAFLGWVASLAFRSDTNARIIIDILTGALGVLAMALALGNSSTFDSLVAGFLGALVTLGLLALIRRRPRASAR